MGIRVLVCDEQILVRAGVRTILHDEDDIDIVGEFGSGREALDGARRLQPSVVVTDIRLAEIDGIQVARRLTKPDAGPPTEVIILTDHCDDRVVLDALAAGARGFVFKGNSGTEINEAIRMVAAGEAFLPPPVIRLLLDRFAGRLCCPPDRNQGHLATLTDREREVLALIAEGRSTAEVAHRLYVSEGTVKSHIHHVFRKLGLRNRVQAAIAAYDAGLADPPDGD
ncbi:MAG: response regulator [Streptosporangiales bacterium]|nr:response regulator [Streptosporangiales bacterium]